MFVFNETDNENEVHNNNRQLFKLKENRFQTLMNTPGSGIQLTLHVLKMKKIIIKTKEKNPSFCLQIENRSEF